MKFPARLLLSIFAFALLAACARLKSDASLPTHYDLHSPDSNAAIWGAGD